MLKKNKTPGVDNLPEEFFKVDSVEVQQQMENLFNKVWSKEYIPEEWKMGVICPIYKKGVKTQCCNYAEQLRSSVRRKKYYTTSSLKKRNL